MISRDLILNVGYTTANLNQPLTIYRYDRNIKLNVEVMGYDFRFGTTGDNLLGQSNIVKAKTYLKSPSGEIFTYPMVETEISNNKVEILINNLMTDESSEIGDYTVQIQLFDEDGSTIHLHPFNFTVLDLIVVTGDSDFDSGENSDIHYDKDYIETENVITSEYLNGIENKLSYLYSDDFLMDKEFEEYNTEDSTTVGAINELLENYYMLNAYYNYLLENMGRHVSYDEYRALSLSYDSNGGISLAADYSSYIKSIEIVNEDYGKHIPVGGYYLFRWIVHPENKYKFNVRWKSKDPTIARVNSSGKVTGVRPGTTTITVYFKYNESVSYSFDVIVGDYNPINSVLISPVNLKLEVNAMGTVTYNIKPADADQSSISYTVEGDPCVYVAQDYENKKFVLTGLSNGTCNLVVYSTENPAKKAICKVTVGDGQYTGNKSISILDPGKYELEVGETLNLECEVEPSNLGVSWKSSNPGVLTVDPTGKITAVSAGFSEVTAYISGYEKVSSTMTFAVRNSSSNPSNPTNPNNYYVIIDSTKLNVKVGDSFLIGATTNPKDANISWEIEDSKVVSYTTSSYTENDLYNETILECRALTIGTTRVYCRFTGDDGNEYMDCQFINVTSDDRTLIIKDPPVFVDLNQSAQLVCVTYPADLAKNVRWKVSNGEIASITQKGLFTATGEGFVRVTCYVADEPEISDEAIICVGDEKLIKGRVYIDREDIPNPPRIGNYFTVKAGTFPENADITWSVDNTSLVDLSVAQPDLPDNVFAHPLLANLILLGEGTANLTCSFVHEGTGELISDTVELNIQSNPNPTYNIIGSELIRCYEEGTFKIKSTDVHDSLYTVTCTSSDDNILTVNSISNSDVKYTANNVGEAELIFTFTSPGNVITTVKKKVEVCPLIPESLFIVNPGEIDGNLKTFQLEHGYNPIDEPNLNRNTYSQVWTISPIDVIDDSATIDNTGLLTINLGDGLFLVTLKTTIFDKLDNKFYEFYAEREIKILQDVIIIIRRNTLDVIPGIFGPFDYYSNKYIQYEGEVDPEDEYIVKYKIPKKEKKISFYSPSDGNKELSHPEVISEVIRLNINAFSELEGIYGLFYNCKSLTLINGISDWDVSGFTNMNSVFYNCESLPSLDLSNWDMSNVTNMNSMFHRCKELHTIKGIEYWKTSNVITINYLFCGCRSLTSLNLSNWDMSKANNMECVFNSCENLSSLTGISNWVTSKVSKLGPFFGGCKSLPSLDLSNWDTSSITDMSSMFQNCENLSFITGIENWNVSKVTHMDHMFYNCKSINTIDLSNWNPSSVIRMQDMFNGCSLLSSIEFLDYWDLSDRYVFMNRMFANCSSLTSVVTYYWNFPSASVGSMFSGCRLQKALVAGKNFKSAWQLFSYCTIEELYIGNMDDYYLEEWDDFLLNATVKKLFIYVSDYKDCNPLLNNIILYANHPTIEFTELDITANDLTNLEYKNPTLFSKSSSISIRNWKSKTPITDTSYMFYKTTYLKEITNLNIDFSNVINMSNMFAFSEKLYSIKGIGNINTSNVTNMSDMFRGCNSLSSLNLSNWDVRNVNNMSNMFAECNSLSSLNLSNWDVRNLKNTYDIFSGNYNLRSLNLSKWVIGYNTIIELHPFTSGKDEDIILDINLSNWNLSNINSTDNIKIPLQGVSCSLNLSNWDLSNISNMTEIVYNTYNVININLDGCNADTVRKLINVGIRFDDSSTIDQYIYVNRNSVEGLTPPEGWEFIYV